jgi:hypothetical protein
MTLWDIEHMDCNTLSVKTVAEFLGKDPQVIRDQAERDPKYLGFPICKAGHSYCIPRLGFIAWVKGQTPIIALANSWKDVMQID